jgi:hypothetical protein
MVNDASPPDDADILRRTTNSVWVDPSNGSIESKKSSGQGGLVVTDRHQSIASQSSTKASPWWESFFKKLAEIIGWIFEGWGLLLLLSLILGVALVVFLVLRNGSFFVGPRSRAQQRERREWEQAKIRDLPFELEQSHLGLLEQAERYRAAGDYSKAIVYLFSHILVEMDSHRLVRIERGKTNQAYLRELREREWLRLFTRKTVDAFEYAFFGRHKLTREEFESIWIQMPQFDERVSKAASPATELGLTMPPLTTNAVSNG